MISRRCLLASVAAITAAAPTLAWSAGIGSTRHQTFPSLDALKRDQCPIWSGVDLAAVHDERTVTAIYTMDADGGKRLDYVDGNYVPLPQWDQRSVLWLLTELGLS